MRLGTPASIRRRSARALHRANGLRPRLYRPARKFSAAFGVMIHRKPIQGETHEHNSIRPTRRAGRRAEAVIPPLASFYSYTRDLSWLIVRLTAGGMLLVHGIIKVMPMAEMGFAATIDAFAQGSMARRGIEPALYAAYAVFFLETIGAVMIMLGLFTRFIAAAAAIQFAVIIPAVLGPHPLRRRAA